MGHPWLGRGVWAVAPDLSVLMGFLDFVIVCYVCAGILYLLN